MKVYGVCITEYYHDVIYDNNGQEEHFDTTRVYASMDRAIEHMKRLAAIDYKDFMDAFLKIPVKINVASPVLQLNEDGTIDVLNGFCEYLDDIQKHYKIVEMELDEEENK
jgi:hypothetical protein